MSNDKTATGVEDGVSMLVGSDNSGTILGVAMEAGSSSGGAGHMMSLTSSVPSYSTYGGESSSGNRQLVMQFLLHEKHEDQDWERVAMLHLVQGNPQHQI